MPPHLHLNETLQAQISHAKRTGYLMLSGGELKVGQIAQVFAELTDTEIHYVNITSPLGKQGGELVADFLRTHPETAELLLDASPLGDEGLSRIAAVIRQHEGIRKFTASECGISPRGVQKFFEDGGANPRLTHLDLLQSDKPEILPLFEEHIRRLNSKNLCQAFPVNSAVDFLLKNSQKAVALIKHYPVTGAKDLSGEQLRGVYERMPLVFWHEKWRTNRMGTDMSAKKTGQPITDVYTAQEDFERLLERLPGFPAKGTETLFTPDESGFAPLDNPLLWSDRTMEDFTSLPLTKELLERRTPKGSSLLDSAFAAFPAEALLEHLHAVGVKVQMKALLAEDGKPSELLARLVDEGLAQRLFTPHNWQGAATEELRKTFEAIPAHAQGQISYQTLRLVTSAPAQAKGR